MTTDLEKGLELCVACDGTGKRNLQAPNGETVIIISSHYDYREIFIGKNYEPFKSIAHCVPADSQKEVLKVINELVEKGYDISTKNGDEWVLVWRYR